MKKKNLIIKVWLGTFLLIVLGIGGYFGYEFAEKKIALYKFTKMVTSAPNEDSDYSVRYMLIVDSYDLVQLYDLPQDTRLQLYEYAKKRAETDSDYYVYLAQHIMQHPVEFEDIELPVKYLLKGAEAKNARACLLLAHMHMGGYPSVDVDLEKAIYYTRLGAELGDDVAMLDLGNMYYGGVRTYQNSKKGPLNMDWMDNTEILDDLTWILKDDREVAKEWWQKAAEKGNDTAKSNLQELQKEDSFFQADYKINAFAENNSVKIY